MFMFRKNRAAITGTSSWYILNDYDCFRGERQKCLRIVQNEPPEELVMSYLAEQPVSAYRDTASGRAGRYDAR